MSESAEPFDVNVERWGRDPLNKECLDGLMVENSKLGVSALCCGILGLGLAGGVLWSMNEFESRYLCREHPTYFGMMISYYY